MIDLAAGNDKLTLGNFTNTGSASNVETVIGGTGADTVTLGNAVTGASIDGGAGNDTLTLASGTNTASMANVETVILHAIPTARLMLNNGPFAEPEGRTRMQARFAAHGIAPDRLILTCTAPQPVTWAAYGEIDIALDPFPHNAGTTTIEALWQGVPVITLAGRPTVGRFGAAILSAVGLSDWVAADPDAYVALAVQAAADPDALAAVRADLRPRFATSPLLRHALAVAPGDAEAHETLGALLCQTGRPIEAEQHHRAALPTLRERHRGLGNLAVSLQTQGRHAEAETCYREALAAKPNYPSGHGNLLFALNYRHDISAETIFAEYRRWNDLHARPITPLPPALPSSGRLRIGYVSPDFRQHAVAHFALPLLAAHDRSAFELFCYAEVAVPDAVTARFQALVDHWRPTVGMTDAAVAAMIRADRIDVLVDMAGHTGGILHTIGLDDWITQTDETYIARAIQAASNPKTLATLRTNLRARITASPLRDAPSLARAIEATYRDLARTPVALAAE